LLIISILLLLLKFLPECDVVIIIEDGESMLISWYIYEKKKINPISYDNLIIINPHSIIYLNFNYFFQ